MLKYKIPQIVTLTHNHSSGEKECIGRITFRGVAALKTISDFHQFNLADWGINF